MSFILLLLFCFVYTTVSAEYIVKVTNNGPVILGANITFRAEVYNNRVKQEGFFKFKWRDNNRDHQNTHEETKQGVSIWTVSHDPTVCKPQQYEVEVRVYLPKFEIDWPICYGRDTFSLKEFLIGELILKQNNTEVTTFISNQNNTQHFVILHGPDNEYLKLNATEYRIEWWIDGVFTNSSSSLSLMWNHKYSKPDITHTVTVYIIATRRKTINSSSSVESSTEADILTSTAITDEMNNSTNPLKTEKLAYSTISNVSNSFCSDYKTQVCGSFNKTFTVKAPINNVKIDVNNWLQHGDMLNLKLTCNGSAPFKFCVRFFLGTYKVVGNETCKYYHSTKADCDFSVAHYFSNVDSYTVLTIVENDIFKNISAIGVTIYEVTKHPQLSVIVVPLTASFLAIVLIIFGVAFYFQNRNSYTIEVADFSISNNNDMEYKTFKERLVEAIHNALTKPEEFSEEDSYNGVPSTSNKKYGSMQ